MSEISEVMPQLERPQAKVEDFFYRSRLRKKAGTRLELPKEP